MRKNSTKILLALALIAIMCFSIVSFAGCNPGCYINAPQNLEAELGLYVIPDYDVVNANGMIMAGYDVRLKSVTGEKGEKIDFDQNSVTINEKGVYKFVYSAKGVKDATVSIDFADRTAPTINFNQNTLPSFFITGNSYRIPSYTLSGDYVREKCYVKVFHIANDANKTETEVEIKSNRFAVTETDGSYEIRIHVEDAVGNVRDYSYARKVDGPEAIRENTIIYFDEAFGERQVYCMESSYTGEYVDNATLGDIAREGENGAYKVTFKGVETENNDGYIALKTPAILDVNGYTELVMYVYNDSDNDAIFGAKWWNDTAIKKGQWTRISFPVDNWGNCVQADNSSKVVGTNDISNMCLRFIFDYNQQVVPNGTFYLSPLMGVPRLYSNVTAGDNVNLDKNSYSIGSTVALTAEEITGKVVDCFLVDGKPIAGDTFVVTEEQHHVTVKYADELTFDNMTWGTGFFYPAANGNWMNTNHMEAQFIGNSDKWVISTDVIGGYNENTGGQTMNLTWMIGDIESIELQLSKDSGLFKWYFAGAGAWNVSIANLSASNFNKLKNASDENPVNVTVMRSGDLLLITIDGEFAGRCELKNGLSSNAFGIGYRKEGADKPDTVILANTKAVIGDERTELYYATLTSVIDKENDDVSTDKTDYRLGDVVTLTAKDKDDGHVFGYFTVDGSRIIGNSFVVTKSSHTVGAVYVNLSAITYVNGVTAAEGNSVGVGTNLTLSHGDAPAQGKVFDHYLVDDTIKVYGNVFTVTENAHTINAVWVDAADITWGDADERYTCEKIMGNEASVWQGREFEGHVFGSAEYWAIKVDVKHTAEWNSFEFVQGSKQSIRIRFHQGNYFGIIVIKDDGSESAPDGYGEFVNAFPNQNAEMVAKLLAGTTITCVRYGDTITMYADDVPFFTTKYAVDHTGNWFGLGHVDRPDGKLPEMTNVKFIMGKDKIDAYLEAFKSTVTVTNATTDKTDYHIGDIVTLTPNSAPEGQIFSHFEVDSKRIEGNSFVVTQKTHNVVAIFREISTITLGAGITTADGETVYVRGATVTLTYDKEALNGKIFNYFTVDGNRILGSEFVANSAKHTVAIVTVDSVDKLTWVDSDEAQTKDVSYNWSSYKFNGKAVAESQHWVMNISVGNLDGFEDGKDKWYGFDVLVGTNASIHIRLHTINGLSITAMGTAHGDGKPIGTVLNGNAVIAACKASTDANPAAFTVIRNGNVYYVLFEGELILKSTYDFQATDSKFGVGKTDCGWLPLYDITNYEYRTGEEVAASKLTSKVSGTNVTLDKADGVYVLGDTVTLTADEAQEGFVFSHFTVNGKAIEGNSFVADANTVSVVAVYEDERQIVVENKPNDGDIVKIVNDEYVLPVAKITDKAGNEIASLIPDVTVTDVAGNNYEITDGKITLAYKGVIEVTVTYASEELGKEVSFTVMLQRSDSDLIIDADETGVLMLNPENCTVEYDTTVKHGSDKGSIKVTLNKDDNAVHLIKADYEGYDFVEYWAYTDGDNVQTGAYWYGDFNLVKGSWTFVRINLRDKSEHTITNGVYHLRIMGSWNNETKKNNVVTGSHVWIASVRLGRYAENQVNDVNISPVVYAYEATMEVATDKVYDGSDTRIVDKTVLKVTGTRDDGEIAFTANTIQLMKDIRGKKLYFYVYAATDPGSCMIGSHWCRNDAAKLNEWVKVEITAETAGLSGVGGNGSVNSPFGENAAGKFIYSAAGAKGVTLYFTSLYVE